MNPSTKTATLAALAGLALAAGSAQAAVIYQDNFDNDIEGTPTTGNLNGTTPDTTTGGNTWTADTNALRDWQADGSIDNGAASPDNNGYAFLEFTPESGKVYTLSIDMTITSGSGSWFGLGFMSTNNTTSAGFYQESTGDGAPWMLLREGDTALAKSFAGPGTAGGVDLASRDGNTMSIVLDTTGTDWVATFNNGSESNSVTYTGLDISNDINYVGFGRNTTAIGSVDNFSLTVVPEPSTTALIGLGGLALILRRRK
ncbi:MAG: PEP-CTERM sorting domain-containing protein [Akkermansiaceae bacterium]|nr:PEP-CTERM sorting domain-containing protein [Akkermansiaceae bacterium]